MSSSSSPGIWRWSKRLPPVVSECKLTLGEGNTPLIRLMGKKIWVKVESMNPTFSFKDRGIAYLISKVAEEDVTKVIIDSSGNAAVSTSAYCARAGMELIAVMPRYSHAEKKTHILWHGARVVEVRDREAARITARLVAKELGYRYVGIALEPAAVPGFKTVAYELQQEIKADSVFVPTGSGTNVVAIERGYKDLEGKLDKFPEIHCVQSAASAPIAGEFVEYKPISSTLAEGVIVPVSERKDEAVKAVRVTGGSGWVVDDDEIYGAMSLLAENGIYTSPTGAVGLAGALKAQLKGRVVCIVTDSGLKSNLMLDSFKSRLISIGDEEPFERVLERLS